MKIYQTYRDLPKLVRLKCRPIKGDDDNIFVDYVQHDEHSDKPNHSHTTIISRRKLRHMLWEMFKYVEDNSVVVALDQAKRKAARKHLREEKKQLDNDE
jgi:hypothetical protein